MTEHSSIERAGIVGAQGDTHAFTTHFGRP
jgi:hypothetical protein